MLTNPALNYAQFLLRAILPTVLHIVIAISAGYAVGSEFGARSVREWLATAGGSTVLALVGKLAPYLGIFLIMMAAGLGIIHGLFQIPFRGDPVLVGASATLLIIAYLSLGALLQLLVGNLAFGLSLTGIICSPAFGFAGVGFPVLAMNVFARGWGMILPLRWYIQILFDQAARGVPPANSVRAFACWARSRSSTSAWPGSASAAVARRPAPAGRAARGRRAAGAERRHRSVWDEYRRVLGNRGAFGLIVLAPIIYGLLYPQPYLGQLIKEHPDRRRRRRSLGD